MGLFSQIKFIRHFMGSIPQVIFGHLWDQSHRLSEDTYGIDPIGDLTTHIGSIPLYLCDQYNKLYMTLLIEIIMYNYKILQERS